MEKVRFNILFGEYIRKVRVAKGLTQIDVASAIGVNPQNISAIERGEVSPTLFWIYKLCVALDLDSQVIISNFFKQMPLQD